MAPNTTGIKIVDQERSLELVEDLFQKLPLLLRPNGNLVFKIFDGPSVPMFIKRASTKFKVIDRTRPDAVRSSSKEFYVVGKGYQPAL
jgi:23S rRNA (uridine2552-2'-O)-methyltransferase